MTNEAAIQKALQYLSSFHRPSQEAMERLQEYCTTGFITKNKNLQPVGHTCRTLYVNIEGLLRIYYLKDGKDITESFEPALSVVARVESLFSGRASRKGIQALEDTVYVAISTPPLFKLFDKHPSLERLFRKVFEAGYVRTVNRLESLQFHSAEEKYRQLLEEQPDILQRAPLKHVASYLGITQVSLSRIRALR
ncbi:MAG: Crp/Fnr family transcriptional regulator [Chitinophagaceae bacterium]|jgi:CRP-like cAMP-binding protein|nr:Crp/Fnr family transcriptional regulator [Chitinophagaceae bacterium]